MKREGDRDREREIATHRSDSGFLINEGLSSPYDLRISDRSWSQDRRDILLPPEDLPCGCLCDLNPPWPSTWLVWRRAGVFRVVDVDGRFKAGEGGGHFLDLKSSNEIQKLRLGST